MSKTIRLLIVFTFVMGLSPIANIAASAEYAIHPDQVICEQLGGKFAMDSNGSTICYWVPAYWNSDLVVFAHGYVDPRLPVGIPWNQVVQPGGISLPKIINTLGYAFGVTSYSKNGLAVKQGVESVFNLVSIFKGTYPNTRKSFLVGASEGGLVTTLAMEKDALETDRVFSGGMSICGPVGDFVKQANYWGDFRLIFDHYFPGVIPVPGDITNPVINIDPTAINNWSIPQPEPLPTLPGSLQADVINALIDDPVSAMNLIKVTKAPIDPFNPQKSTVETTLAILGYNIISTNEGRGVLSGISSLDLRTNLGSPYSTIGRNFQEPNGTPIVVTTYDPDPLALAEIFEYYSTTGKIKVPLVGMHTTGDPIVPSWQEQIYRSKTQDAGTSRLFTNILINRYGHCNFKPSEAVFGFVVMIIRATFNFSILQNVNAALPDAASQQEFWALKNGNSDLFTIKTFIPFIQR